MDQHYLFNSITTIVFALGIFVLFGWYCYILVKTHKRPLGELLTWQAIKHNESIFVMMMIVACVAEGISAATVLAPGLIAANPIARVSSHLFISFAGIIGSMTLFKDTAQVLFPGADGVSRFFQFVVVIFLTILALGSPLLNLILMAGNLKQELEFELFYFHLNPLTTGEEWQSVLEYYGKDKHWSAWAALEPNLKVSVGITFLHFIIAGLEGARSMSTPKRREELMKPIEDKPKEEENKDKSKDKDKDKDESGMQKNLAILLKFFGQYGADDIEKLSGDAYNVLHKISDTSMKAKMGIRISTLVQESVSLKDSKDDKKIKDLKEKIRNLFGGSKSEKDYNKSGFGITLKSVK